MFATAALAAVTFASAPAGAGAIMSVNNITTDKMSHEECMKLAARVVKDAGFRYHDTTSQAVWATANDRRDMVMIYCPTSRDIAIFAAASPTGRGEVTEPLVDRMTEAWDRANK